MMKTWALSCALLSLLPATNGFTTPYQVKHSLLDGRRSTSTEPQTPRGRASTCHEMCGLVALIAPTDGSVKHLQDITEQTERILHRGPDGMEVKSEVHAGGSFALGHTRLAIVDPSHAGDQPFELTFSNEKTYHLAANGEIYNHKDIYAKMVEEGWTEARKSQSDCEVIAHAYAKYGVDAVKYLDGMFAFCIVEQDKEGNIVSVLAARDRVGIKPLYHGISQDGSHVFASELKSLVGLVEPSTVVAIPAGHYWTPESGLQRFHNPDWLCKVS